MKSALARAWLSRLRPQTRRTTMVGLTKEQRRTLIDKLPDTANLALGGLVFGQFLQGRPFSRVLAAAGVFVWLALLGYVLLLGQEGQT